LNKLYSNISNNYERVRRKKILDMMIYRSGKISQVKDLNLHFDPKTVKNNFIA